MIGGFFGLAAAVGLILVYLGLTRGRTPTATTRIDPYLRDVLPLSQIAPVGVNAPSAALRRGAAVVDQAVGGSMSVRRRLLRLGSTMSVEQFRAQQVVWGLTGFGVSTLVCAILYWSRGANVVVLVMVCCAGFLGGVLARDQKLGADVKRYETRLAEEFPTVADLLALSVAAGEGPIASLERVTRVCHGELAGELDRVLGAIRTGTPLVRAFDDLAARTGVPTIARFAEGLAVAVERGTPLVDVLHAQAADVRESARRGLIETGGRKEVAMMVPVVFLLLPVTVLFAFFPGFIGLHLTSGM